MNFTALKTELGDRGFSFLTDTRLGQYINAGYHEFNEEELWSWRVTTTTPGASPVTISDLGPIEEVLDVPNNVPLQWRDRRTLREETGDLTITGTPVWFYRDDLTTVRTYPVATTNVTVRYYKIAADLSGGSDNPIIPVRYHLLIVDYAARQAYRDSHRHQEAEQLEVEIERRLGKVRETMLETQFATGDRIVITGQSEDW